MRLYRQNRAYQIAYILANLIVSDNNDDTLLELLYQP